MIIDSEKIIKKLLKEVQKDTRTSLERGSARKPKFEYLFSIKKVILLMLDSLFSVSEQLELINKHFENSVSDTTYIKFLRLHLKDEYLKSKKNKYMALRNNKIAEAISLFEKESYAKQLDYLAFTGKINGKAHQDLDITLDNYKEFLNDYYYKDIDDYRNKYESTDDLSDTNFFTSSEAKKSNLDINDGDVVVCTETKNDTLSGQIEVDLSHGYVGEIMPLADEIDFANIKQQITIYRDFKYFFESDMDMLLEYVTITNQDIIEEELKYFMDIDVLQFCDLKTLSLKEEQLIVVNGEYDDEPGCLSYYRYYKGAIYKVGKKSCSGKSPSFFVNCEGIGDTHNSIKYSKLVSEYLDFKREHGIEVLFNN